MKQIPANTVITMLWAIYDQDSDVNLHLRVRALVAIAAEFCIAVPEPEALQVELGRAHIDYTYFTALCAAYMVWPAAIR